MASGITKVYEEYSTTPVGQNITGPGTITVEEGARITASGDNGFELFSGPFKLTIDGLVEAQNNGIVFYSKDIVAPLKNSTVIVGVEGTVVADGAFNAISSEQAVDITNSGLILGGDSSGFGISLGAFAPSSSKAVTITNTATGTITGDGGGINDTDESHALVLKNQGTISDVAWIGDATITNSGNIGGLNQYTALLNHNVSVTNSGSINGSVTFRDGNDVLKNTGAVQGGVDFGDGSNTLTNGGNIFGGIAGGAGNDTFTSTGSISNDVDLGGGVNKFTNSGGIGGTVTFGDKDNTMTNSGDIFGAITFGNGDNTFSSSGILYADVTFGTGSDTMTNKGEIESVILGTGDNKFTNNGIVNEDVTAGDGEDTLINTKFIYDNVDLGKGDDVVTNSGLIFSLNTGEGDDKVTYSASGSSDIFFGGITLGGGNDTFIGGNARDEVYDGQGDDNYKLNGGDDQLIYNASGHDTIDGGAGIDTLSAPALASSLLINLDAKAAVTLNATLLTAATLQSGVSIGTIKGIEAVEGSSKADLIAGSKANETLYGQDGADFLYGGGGVDFLDGGNGADTYVFLSITDTGKTRATRDVIGNFVSATDKIDLSAIDANSKTANNDAFNFKGNNVAFTKVAGELRAVDEAGHTVIQGDINGDGKADFTIDVVGTVTFAGTDFAL